MTVRALVFTVSLSFALTAIASASPISVANFSFETLPVGGLPIGCAGTGCAYSIDAIPGWTNSGFSGQFQPGTQDGTFLYFNTLSDGITNAYSNGGTISQTVAATVQAGVVYTLEVDLGWGNDVGFDATADLLVNGIQYSATGTMPVRGNWSTYTATYIGKPGDVGDSITIQLNSSGEQGNFDNVRLDASSTGAVPEPVSTVLVGSGLAAFGVVARRKGANEKSRRAA